MFLLSEINKAVFLEQLPRSHSGPITQQMNHVRYSIQLDRGVN